MRGGRYTHSRVETMAVFLLVLTGLLYCLIFYLDRQWGKKYERMERQYWSVTYELNRHSLILVREGLAKPEDQLGLPIPPPEYFERKLEEDDGEGRADPTEEEGP